MSNIKNLGEGRYLYCVVDNPVKMSFGNMGIEDSDVFIVPFKDIGVVVHKCLAKPYVSENGDKVKEWVLSHQYIIDQATKGFGTVMPFSFDVIIKGDERRVIKWLKEKYTRLKGELERLKNKSEYKVQIFFDEVIFFDIIKNSNQKIRELEEETRLKSKGLAYMIKKKVSKLLKEELKKQLVAYSDTFYNRIGEHVTEIKTEKPVKLLINGWKDKRMMMNLCCLVHEDNVEELGNILGEINDMSEFSIRFSGPWPPFSFVGGLNDG